MWPCFVCCCCLLLLFVFITPYAVFKYFAPITGGWVLLCKDSAENSPYITMQRIATFESSTGGVAGVNVLRLKMGPCR